MFSNTSRRLALSLFFVTAILIVLLVPLSSVFAYPAWDGNFHPYAVGDLVTYQGRDYRCQQAHTSQPDWTPPATPALWVDLGPTGGTTAPTSTRTNTPVGPTATRTNTPVGPTATKTNTPVGPTATKTNTPVGPTATRTKTPTPGAGGTISRVGMYYADWDIYARNYQPKQLETSGTAAKLTDLIFAFGNTAGGACAIGDAYADYQKLYGVADSVSGVADTDSNNAGIINQLKELKAKHPGLRVFWSFGGWTWSGGFTQAAANPTAFATSCWNLVNDARWSTVFDGIDLDWEYPNACGLSCDTSGPNAFKNVMAAMWNSSLRGGKMVTAAIGSDDLPGGKMDQTDYAGAAQYVNWFDVMTYDYFGAWATTGPTAPHSPLNSYAGIPTAGWDTQDTMSYWRGKGIPASKLGFGIGFYGRGWTGVTQSTAGGSATGAASGTYEAGVDDYKVLVNSCPPTGTVGGTSYSYCGNNWWSYDTPSTIAGKMSAMKASGNVSGVFIWEANSDTTSGTLITAVYNNK